jgi:hypothetical protein
MKWGVIRDKRYSSGLRVLNRKHRIALSKATSNSEKHEINKKHVKDILELKTKIADKKYPNNSHAANKMIQDNKNANLATSYFSAKYYQAYANDKDRSKHPIRSSVKAGLKAAGSDTLNNLSFGLHGLAEGQKNRSMRSDEYKMRKNTRKALYYSEKVASGAAIGASIAVPILTIYKAYKVANLVQNKAKVNKAFAEGNVFDA